MFFPRLLLETRPKVSTTATIIITIFIRSTLLSLHVYGNGIYNLGFRKQQKLHLLKIFRMIFHHPQTDPEGYVICDSICFKTERRRREGGREVVGE